MAVTLKTIAERVGVSVQAVSYVMNSREVEMRISPDRTAEIRRVARELNYIPNASARAMVTKKTRQIGVLVRVAKNGNGVHPRGLETIMGMNAALEPSGNIVVIIPVTGDDTSDRVESRVFRERLLDGLIMLDDVPDVDIERAVSLVNPTVWVNSNEWGESNCLRRDEFTAGRVAASELFRLGYRKLIYADKSLKHHYSTIDRLAGAMAFAKESGMAIESHDVPVIYESSLLPPVFRHLKRDTAVLACDSYTARRLQGAFGELGLRPGPDFALACCDDASEFSWTWPRLARVKYNRYQMGEIAAEMILRRIADAKTTVESQLLKDEWLPGSTALPACAV